MGYSSFPRKRESRGSQTSAAALDPRFREGEGILRVTLASFHVGSLDVSRHDHGGFAALEERSMTIVSKPVGVVVAAVVGIAAGVGLGRSTPVLTGVAA